METINISGRTCHIIMNGAELPVVYWGEMKNSTETIEKVSELCKDTKCNFIVYEIDDWNSEFSPWEFRLNKKMYFSGNGRNTLEWLTNKCIPYCEKEYKLTGQRIICGYSLAGLFSLWAFYESRIFSGVISCSGSLWFGDWISYAESHSAPLNSSAYLSLGDREEKARDRIMATVGDCTRRQYEIICGDENITRHAFEWNDGGHFNEPEKRLAKGIKWMTTVYAEKRNCDSAK